jgi:hypothetical protein
LAIWQSLPVAERARFGQRSAPPEAASVSRQRAATATPRQSAPPQTKESREAS